MSSDTYNPNRLFDVLLHKFQLDDDKALAHALNVEPYLIERIRFGEYMLDPSLLIRINEVFDINMRELRQLTGDRRAEYRLTDAPHAPQPEKEAAHDPEDGEERGKLRRSHENDDGGMPNFVQWN
ncbi:hypothetical protein EGT07_08295 [Herbaspirillum sp. HC18]|nr:hypothetical protein EGT07_08295 [Herbaspirillum sp. HC18]